MIHQTAKRVRQKSACEAKGGPLWVRIARGRPYSSKVAVNTACTAGVVCKLLKANGIAGGAWSMAWMISASEIVAGALASK